MFFPGVGWIGGGVGGGGACFFFFLVCSGFAHVVVSQFLFGSVRFYNKVMKQSSDRKVPQLILLYGMSETASMNQSFETKGVTL